MPEMSGDLAFRTGLLLGEFMSRGVDAAPIVDAEGNYTNVIEVRLDDPFRDITLYLKVSLTGD